MKQLIFTLLLMPAMLFGALTFDSNHNKEVALLKSFDINPYFLNDPVLIRMKAQKETKYQKQHFFKAMDEAYLFIPTVKQILTDSGMPAEFLFLAMAESNFSLKAYSKKSASGLWQFMPGTGKMYGLKIDEYVDERRDLIKSTDAAVKYLSYLHKKFGKWYLAALAYNCGEGRLSRAIKKAGSDDLAVLLDPKRKYIPRESRFYIRKIVALALLGSDESYMIDAEYDYLLNRANAYSLATVKLARGEKLSRVAKLLDMPFKDLKKLNSHLKYDFMPPYEKGYDVYIPFVKLTEFKQKYKPAPLGQIYVVHKVKSGDNLSYLGKKYNVPYKMIKDFNNLKTSMLSLNQKLIIPTRKIPPKTHRNYVVKRGDSLLSIAKQFHVSVRQIKQMNHMTSDIIRIGEALTIHD
ncbi:MAG: transglycosylase SLT domain-containing protein [Campylobacterota bacterium]|nr:transglycosylase SLT domain-containing protein [Campylobacterota bacterium]